MWTIKHIFDGDFGCEETADKCSGPKVSVTLVNETGDEKYVTVADQWLIQKNLDIGSVWPKDIELC